LLASQRRLTYVPAVSGSLTLTELMVRRVCHGLTKNALVAQLDRALDYESRGREFESSRARHFLQIFLHGYQFRVSVCSQRTSVRAVVRGSWALVERLIEELGGDIVTIELES
jgi:uncharacterized protein YpiB (UPF0302 family)